MLASEKALGHRGLPPSPALQIVDFFKKKKALGFFLPGSSISLMIKDMISPR